jgi:hypothetical protein
MYGGPWRPEDLERHGIHSHAFATECVIANSHPSQDRTPTAELDKYCKPKQLLRHSLLNELNDRAPINLTIGKSVASAAARVALCSHRKAPRRYAQSALTSTFDADGFLLNLLSRSRLCASIQSSPTLPSIAVVSGTTKLSIRSLQNSVCPIWACKQLQHCESGTTCGNDGGITHLRPVTRDSAQRVTIAAVRAWPQE